MTSPEPIVSDVRHVIAQIQSFKIKYRKTEEDLQYKEWCEGIMDAAIGALKVISGD